MNDPAEIFKNALNLAVDFLRKEKARTEASIRATAEKAAQAMAPFAPGESPINVDELTARLNHVFSIEVQKATVLDDDDTKRHVVWLPNRKAGIKWRFWERYQTYLERDFGLAPAMVSSLHELTDTILDRLEDPSRDGPWDRRGMVVGSVQSGKTANYIGLINKAVDAGYKLVIILAGIHSNLRSQTQLRVDEGVIGFDTQKSRRVSPDNQWVGVGQLPGETFIIHPLTSSAESGDFNKRTAETQNVMIGSDPVILVVKKNSRLLGNLLKWVLHVAGSDHAGKDKKTIRNVPLLLIDDEADNASINVKDEPSPEKGTVVSAINGRIRHLLAAFEKSAYVGYTATPFANIFINPEAESVEHGMDLFPRSFIINVKPPSNYVGPSRVFGLDGDPDAGIEAADGLPIVHEISDYAHPSMFPPKHTKDHLPTELPASLRRALRCFILSCAARRARGQARKHNSMLVHVTRFVNVQGHAVALLRAELGGLQRRISNGDGARIPTLRDELQELWEDEFVPVSRILGDESGPPVSWLKVDEHLHEAAAKIVVLPINGSAKDALDYKEHEAEGRSVVAVGGDKLSRGLTLEGLSISYFLRTSRMYDTLMQMGRWFGYRPGYLDLCRLFTTGQLVTWYRHIALADAELRREFDYMVDRGETPENYGLRVRTHPDGMTVTALNKMAHGRNLELSWSGLLVQSTQLPKDEKRTGSNLERAERLIASLGEPDNPGGRGTCVWREVAAAKVGAFMEALSFPPHSLRAGGTEIASFIRGQIQKADPELTTWTIALISADQGVKPRVGRSIAEHAVKLVERSAEEQSSDTFSLKKANLLNPSDEGLDFEEQPFTHEWFRNISAKPELAEDLEWLSTQVRNDASEVALELTKRWLRAIPPKLRSGDASKVTRPNGRVLRSLRRRTHGLLLIYPLLPPVEVKKKDGPPAEPTGLSADSKTVIAVAVSFPTSNTAQRVGYRVNPNWNDEIGDDSFEDDD